MLTLVVVLLKMASEAELQIQFVVGAAECELSTTGCSEQESGDDTSGDEGISFVPKLLLWQLQLS